MLSWAVPKGPSYDPRDRRVAMHVEDHPISYNTFEGTIPANQYGAGSVIVWDRGTWTPIGDPRKGMEEGKLVFALHGQKLAGQWELVRIRKPGERQDPWLLFKKRDAYARSKEEYDVVTALPDSVVAKPLGALSLPPRPVADNRIATVAKRPADLAGAEKAAALPAKLAPQLATATEKLPAHGADRKRQRAPLHASRSRLDQENAGAGERAGRPRLVGGLARR
jgi:bifunctional non-homologous end joining protein LigD